MKKIIMHFLIIFISMCLEVFSESLISRYTLMQNKDNIFILKIFDEKDTVVYQETFEKEPFIEVLNKQIIEIRISVGSPQNYTYFYDISAKKTSNIYDNALLIEDGKVIFLIEDKLIVSDYMGKKCYLSKKLKNLAHTAVPVSAIVSVKLFSENKIEVIYFNQNFDEISEEFQWK